ncbi:MAG: hypothetical protein CMM48_07945 [Rhodospirillaceae bacterium]|nr:hypothetical protein [Rhodospirillaceae bacterium]HAA92594.1 hypothetical protein [Rhodospirillaceae bacterium]|tara:strand:- start:178 stop:399 length:222 start_codon:yes stop_codon:yes gene_type:complete
MSRRRDDQQSAADESRELEALNRLFGRDIGADGWVVKDKRARGVGKSKPASERRRQDSAPDPSMIWAMRGRKR